MRDRYIICYTHGRLDTFEGEVDLDALLERVRGGAPIRETTLDVARKAVMPEMGASAKVEWLKDNLETIRELGGDTEKAWRMFCQGRIDGLAWHLEDSVIEELTSDDGDDDEDPDAESDEDGDDDEDSDDDDEEEEDDED